MGLCFKFDQVVPEIFEFQHTKKGAIFRQDLGETYISGMAPKRRILEGVLPFSGKKLFVKSDVKISACFMQNFMKLDMKKKIGSQSCDIWGLGPQNQFRAIWAKSLCQNTYQAVKSRTIALVFTNRTSFLKLFILPSLAFFFILLFCHVK